MEVAPSARRRKACDLCVAKRIKCDNLKPTCSNCQLYGVDCRLTTVDRRAPSRRRAIAARRAAGSPDSDRVRAMEIRLGHIENMMRAVTGLVGPLAPGTDTFGDESTASMCTDTPPYDIASSTLGGTREPPSKQESPRVSDLVDVQSPQLRLPDIEEVMPVVERYFRDFNSIIPLFHAPPFMRMLHNWCVRPSVAEWAAINIVMALCYRVIDDLKIEDHRLARCVHNVQSVLPGLLMRGQDLLGVQILLGLVLLLQGTENMSLTPVLMGSAIRLAMCMKLHRRSGRANLAPAVALHRSRVFWIAYILDRDTSARFQVPPCLPEAEIEHDLPPCDPEDKVSNLYSTDGTAMVNYLRLRVQLAHIQGKMYELLQTRSSETSLLEKRERVARLEEMLHKWTLALPPDFRIENIQDRVPSLALYHMIVPLYSHLEALFVVKDIHFDDDQLIGRIKCYIHSSNRESADEPQYYQQPLPASWNECVVLSRAALTIETGIPRPEYFLVINACAQFAAGIVLMTNIIEHPDQETVEIDQALIDHQLELYDRMSEDAGYEKYALRSDIHDLNSRAKEAVKRCAEQGSVISVAQRFSFEELLMTDFGGDGGDWAGEVDGITLYSTMN